jgi:hypothetical protein
MKFFALILLSALTFPQAEVQLPLDKILSQKDFNNYQKKEKYNDRVEILRKALEKKSKRLHSMVERLESDPVILLLRELRGIISAAHELSMEESNEKELRHKEVKRMEIALRKLGEDLDDLKLQFPYERRSPFELTGEKAEEFRERLLQQLFGEALGDGSQSSPGLKFAPSARFMPSSSMPSSQGLWDMDKFTESEFSEIQMAQELEKRTEVFLEIAESRLGEIERRIQGTEWEDEEPNPLEFYLYEDLLHAYARAINGVMINIDDKVEQGRTSDKEIRKSLQKLLDKIEEFAPRLEKMEDLVRKERDMDLLHKYREALKKSDQAYKGAKFGLGSVPNEK